MQNRPLPAIPPSTDSAPDHRASPRLRNWTSLDDDVIPHHTRMHGQARLRDSPKRRPQRPQSEVILDSKLYNAGISGDQPGVYIYGFKSHTQNQLSSHTQTSPDCPSKPGFSANFSNSKPMHQPSQNKTEMNIKPGQQPYLSKGSNSNGSLYSPKGSYSLQKTSYDNMHSLQNGSSASTSHIHFVNGSPNHTPNVNDVTGEDGNPTKAKEKGSGYVYLLFLAICYRFIEILHLFIPFFSSTGQRPASYCHGVVSVVRPSVRVCVCKLFLQKTSPQKLLTGFL